MSLFDAGAPASRARATARVKLVVAYDGTDFHGFAPQHAVRTVGGALSDAIATVLQVDPDRLSLACAGRTDTGVHAWGQVASIDVPGETDVERLQRAVNRITGPEVVVRHAEVAAPDFDARRRARWRSYRYTIVNRPEPDPFLSRYAWWISQPLDVSLLRLAADPFVGEHDFAAFCRRSGGGSTVRRVLESRWHPPVDGVLRYEIRAGAFCWQMVRSVVGLLVEAGAGRRRPGDVLAVLRSGDRAKAGQLAPALGLCLWDVGYDREPPPSPK